MNKIIQCVPNFSEGRNEETLSALVAAAQGISGVSLLDYSADVDHNRSVFTLLGNPQGIAEAAFALCRVAIERIDMRKHQGEHPRMGACDVLPFVPIKNIDTQECVALSKQVAERLWKELSLPSFLYEASASTEHRRNLADCRRGEFEGMAQKVLLPEWLPDFGGPAIHSTAGICAIGARRPLIAFNVNLNTADLSIAKAIAKTIRASSGGYAACKAIGIMLHDRNIAQVSMNIVDFEVTPLYRVIEAIRFEARRYGVSIIGSELLGVVPTKALCDTADYYLGLEAFNQERQVLENRLLE